MNSTMNPEPSSPDREYGLAELLQSSAIAGLCRDFTQTARFSLLVFHPDGEVYYNSNGCGLTACLSEILRCNIYDRQEKVDLENGGSAVISPIEHELEKLGYLALAMERSDSEPRPDLLLLGEVISGALRQIMRYHYRYLLTSDLQGHVVRESYDELLEKTALIEESECKYRTLSQNLEVEVQKKTEKIRDTQAQLLQQEKMASIGQLAAGVAHEINNPTGFVNSNLSTLSSYVADISRFITGGMELIAELKDDRTAAVLPDSLRRKAEQISRLQDECDISFILDDINSVISESRDGMERIKKIVIALKDFAHPGEDKVKFADINHGIESTLNVVCNELKYKAEIEKDLGDIPEIECYPQQLNQVFMNILVNASQAIETRGKIKIVTRLVDGVIEVRISDTGVGIPEENLSKIFDPFFTTKEVGKGTGLGMNVAHNIIQKHNGTISVESKVGSGTTFIVRLPVLRS
jgi:two-component system, NtrC family, sensor kinase